MNSLWTGSFSQESGDLILSFLMEKIRFFIRFSSGFYFCYKNTTRQRCLLSLQLINIVSGYLVKHFIILLFNQNVYTCPQFVLLRGLVRCIPLNLTILREGLIFSMDFFKVCLEKNSWKGTKIWVSAIKIRISSSSLLKPRFMGTVVTQTCHCKINDHFTLSLLF